MVWRTTTAPIVGVRPASDVRLATQAIHTPAGTSDSERGDCVISRVNPVRLAPRKATPGPFALTVLKHSAKQRGSTSNAGIPKPGPWAASYSNHRSHSRIRSEDITIDPKHHGRPLLTFCTEPLVAREPDLLKI